MLSICVIVFTSLIAIICIILYFDQKKKGHIYVKQIKEREEQLNQYTRKVDNFIKMLTNIHEYNMKITSITKRETMANYIVDSVCNFFNCETVSVMLLNSQKNKLVTVASRGLPEKIQNLQLKVGQGIPGKVAETGNPTIVENIETDTRFSELDKEYYPSKTLISIPMETKNKIIGVLNISPKNEKNIFDTKIMQLLSVLGDHSAVALENLNLYENLQKFYIQLAETLAKTIDTKNAYTHDHADRARKLTHSICKKLKLPDVIIKYVEYAALLHDIGKIGIDNMILNKPGKLTEGEFKQIKQHPIIGFQMLEPIVFLSPVLPMIEYHQEWYNGKGYPEGLKGEEIPLGARIVAVIDAYDAMTYDRPYRKSLGKVEAVKELKKHAGLQFDPEIVKVFINLLKTQNEQ